MKKCFNYKCDFKTVNIAFDLKTDDEIRKVLISKKFFTSKVPMLNKYGDLWYSICTFKAVTSY